jgi:hypothetical protein
VSPPVVPTSPSPPPELDSSHGAPGDRPPSEPQARRPIAEASTRGEAIARMPPHHRRFGAKGHTQAVRDPLRIPL